MNRWSMPRRPRRPRDQRGAVAVEFGLITPILLLLVFGIMEFGYMLNRDTLVNNASRDGARVAALGGSYADIQSAVTTELAGSGIPTTAPTTVDHDRLHQGGRHCLSRHLGELQHPGRLGDHRHGQDRLRLQLDHAGHLLDVRRLHDAGAVHPDEGRVSLYRRLGLRRRQRDEVGAVAILMAVLALVICMFAAYAVDIGMQVNRKHMLNDTLDAAAQAGAYELPTSSADAATEALAFAKAHDPSEDGALKPNVDFWCIVASKLTSGSYGVDTTQIPSTCNPGTAPYTVGANYKSTARTVTCSQILCAIPCVEPTPNNGSPKIACNTIRVYQGRDVPFAFAPAGGIDHGGTGNLISVACKGSCGTVAPNPMDVVVIADRTPSMAQSNVDLMAQGIKDMLKVMTPSQQYVALGTIGRSTQTSTNSAESKSCTSSSGGLTYPGSPSGSGLWVPISFSDDYVDGSGALKTSDKLVKGVSCIPTAFPDYHPDGTFLAAPMKAGARYLLGKTSNNLSSLPARADLPRKVLIFETDGQPYENVASKGSTSLDTADDIISNKDTKTTTTNTVGPTTSTVTTNPTRKVGTTTYTDTYNTTNKVSTKTNSTVYSGGQTACSNLASVAANAKAAGILVITIAYNLSTQLCGGNNPNNSNATTVDEDTTITAISPSGARTTTADGKLALNTSYKGNATVTRTYTKLTTYDQYSDVPDTSVGSVLAAAASPKSGGAPSTMENCATSAGRALENSDGDYFFCGASGVDMAPIFKTALSQVSKGIKLIKMP